MISLDPIAVIAAMREVAETIILPRFQSLQAGDVRAKTHAQDLVTVADEEGEERLAVTLPSLLHGSRLIGEESVAKRPELLDHLVGEDWVWIVDPVDGTVNFVNGSPVFCTMAALAHKGETVWGFIHDPLRNETLWAERGAGAFLTVGTGAHERLFVPKLDEASDLSVLSAAIYDKDMAPIKGKFARVSRSGCAGQDYWAATQGRLHVVSFRRLMPWDHAPGVLIHGQAGGFNRMLNGAAYSAAMRAATGILCAPNQEIWNRIVAVRQLHE